MIGLFKALVLALALVPLTVQAEPLGDHFLRWLENTEINESANGHASPDGKAWHMVVNDRKVRIAYYLMSSRFTMHQFVTITADDDHSSHTIQFYLDGRRFKVFDEEDIVLGQGKSALAGFTNLDDEVLGNGREPITTFADVENELKKKKRQNETVAELFSEVNYSEVNYYIDPGEEALDLRRVQTKGVQFVSVIFKGVPIALLFLPLQTISERVVGEGAGMHWGEERLYRPRMLDRIIVGRGDEQTKLHVANSNRETKVTRVH